MFFKGNKVSSLYILLEGHLRILNDEKTNPLIKPIHLLNHQLLYAVSPIDSEIAVFVSGESKMLELRLSDILQVRRDLKKGLSKIATY